VTFRGKWSRLRVLEGRVRGAEFVEVGGGRRIAMTPAEKYATFIDALAEDDTPTIQAIRSGAGKPDAGEFAQFINALYPLSRMPPSGDWDEPWVDAEDPADDLVDDLIAPEEFRPGGAPGE
jgi:hypothetical protein